jgi:hypothetical protein
MFYWEANSHHNSQEILRVLWNAIKTADEYLDNVTVWRYSGTTPPNFNCVTKEIKSSLSIRMFPNILFKKSYLTVCYVKINKNHNNLINCLHKESSHWKPTSSSSN